MAINNVEYILYPAGKPTNRINFSSRDGVEGFLQRQKGKPVYELMVRGRNRHGVSTAVTWGLGRIVGVDEFRATLAKPTSRARIEEVTQSEEYLKTP
jgi:hypothetical protein